MKRMVFAAGAALMMVVVPGLSAQQSAFRPAPSALFSVAPARATVDTTTPPATHWKEGAILVGIPMAILGGIAGHGLCEWGESPDDGNCVGAALGVGLLAGAVGAITGGLIGGLFPKHD